MISDMNCREFTEVLASPAPIPGGGSSSAYLGAISVSLAHMVGSLTVGKPKFADVEEELLALMKRADTLRREFLDLMEQDAAQFQALMEVFKLPKDTPEQQEERARVLEEALVAAATPPLEIMRKCVETIALCKAFVDKGSKLAISDAGVGAVLCKAAMQGAALNVYANTKLMKNHETAKALNEEADQLMFGSAVDADEAYGKVYSQLRQWWKEDMK